ncbi:MAG: lipoate--protein ligase family protein [Acidimicrobiales bacterium]
MRATVALMELAWKTHSIAGSAAELHAFRPPDPTVRSVVFMHPLRPAIVLGSSQRSIEAVVAERAGDVAVAVRDSGGGAVLVAPGAQVWIALYLPSGDPLAVEDLPSSFLWLGDLTARTLERLGAPHYEICTYPSERSEISRAICFAGSSYGELLIEGRKLTGISQRRTRSLRIYHLMIALQDRQSELLELLNPLYGDVFSDSGTPFVTTLAAELDRNVTVAETEESFRAVVTGRCEVAGI